MVARVARVVRLLPLIEMVEMVVLVGAVALPLIIKAALIIDPVVGVDIPVVEAVVITVATQIMVEAVVALLILVRTNPIRRMRILDTAL
jgi:hypothetical protein